MAQDYTIKQVSSQPPREWAGPKGTVYYIKVKLEGHEKPVSIGKKAPDALKVGDTVYGSIIPDGMHEEDKFKSEQNPSYAGGSTGGSSKPSYQPKDDAAIKAMWAIGQAMNNAGQDRELDLEHIEGLAANLFAMVDRVKAGTPTQEEVDKEVAAAIDLFQGTLDEDGDSF